MKIKNWFFICMLIILAICFFGCRITQDAESINEPEQSTETSLSRATLNRFCPATSFAQSGYASGSYNCAANSADISATGGGGTLTFRMTDCTSYIVTGTISKSNYNGNAKFSTPGGSIIATTSAQSFIFSWTAGNCTFSCDSGTGTSARISGLYFYCYRSNPTIPFCPATSFAQSGYASGSYNCAANSADISATGGGGTLTFSMTGGTGYNVTGSIIKSNNNGNGRFSTPGGSITATTSYQSFSFTWTAGNCTFSGDSGTGTNIYIKDLVFRR